MDFANSFRKNVVWLVLLALLAPGLTLAQAACCEPQLAKPADCCAQVTTMSGMDAAQMKVMDGAAGRDSSALSSAVARCSIRLDSEVLDFVVPNARIADGSPFVAIDHHPAVADRHSASFSFEGQRSLLLERTPPRAFQPDPLNILRI